MTIAAAVLATLVALATFAALRRMHEQPYYWVADEVLEAAGGPGNRDFWRSESAMLSWMPESMLDVYFNAVPGSWLTIGGPPDRPFWMVERRPTLPWSDPQSDPMQDVRDWIGKTGWGTPAYLKEKTQ